MRVVLDTNVVVSGLMLPDSTPGRIVAAWAESEFDVVSSPEQLAEIARVLGYPKIRRVWPFHTPNTAPFVATSFLFNACPHHYPGRSSNRRRDRKRLLNRTTSPRASAFASVRLLLWKSLVRKPVVLHC